MRSENVRMNQSTAGKTTLAPAKEPGLLSEMVHASSNTTYQHRHQAKSAPTRRT